MKRPRLGFTRAMVLIGLGFVLFSGVIDAFGFKEVAGGLLLVGLFLIFASVNAVLQRLVSKSASPKLLLRVGLIAFGLCSVVAFLLD